jgi:peptidoglycan/xylan/chitin deacetylase (PgdA/CDA1 family)
MVEPRFDIAVTRVTPAQFAHQVETVLRAGFAILPLQDYLNRPEPRERAIALTFDDAYASVYEHAFPVLKQYGLRATLFVITRYMGKLDDWDVNFGHIRFPHMTAEQVVRLAAEGWEIGSHSMRHLDLSRLSQNLLEEEVMGSRRTLEQLTGQKICTISYPFGNTDERVVDCCRKAGYRNGVVMGGLNKQLEVSFNLPRLGVYLYDFPALFEKKVFGKYEKMFNFIQRGIDICSDGTVLVKQGIGKPRKSA